MFFAEEGFSASTRDLADRLGVRQALLYKYYPSKEALLDSIFETVFSEQLSMEFTNLLQDSNKPLLERICALYAHYVRERDGIGVRLFLRAALDHYPLPKRMAEAQRHKLMIPLIAALRADSGLKPIDEVPVLIGEYELALMLHGSVVFNQIRTHVYGLALVEDSRSLIRLYIATFLDGVRGQLRQLHDAKGGEGLSAPLPA